MRTPAVLVVLTLTVVVLYAWTEPSPGGGRVAGRRAAVRAPAAWGEPIRPVEEPPWPPEPRALLGREVFHDPGLSADGTVACASCHDVSRHGADGRPVPRGIGGRRGRRNAPTVFNAALHATLFWDGRADTLEELVSFPLTAAHEMGSSWDGALRHLASSPLAERFVALYGGVTREAVEDALAAYQRALLTPGAPFDRWLAGDAEALAPEAVEGYALFKDYGCVSCHQGEAVGGNLFHRLGLFVRPGAEATDRDDPGRGAITGRPEDQGLFKVPSLRNVALTAPYLHDGSVATLPEVIDVMAEHQLGRELEPGARERLVAFLESLTGPLPRIEAP